MQEATFQITGMSCGHCVKAVEQALDSIDGVTVREVAIGEAKVQYDTSKVNADDIRRAIEEEGYPVEA
jgi:copper chaperone